MRRILPAADLGTASTNSTCSAATFLAFQILSKLFRRYKKTFGYRELANMRQTKKHVMGKLLREKENSYKIYLDQCRSPCGY